MEPIILPRISDQKPLVSIVSITYNHEPYIRACLDSFLMQKTNFTVEIIIHDDASTDHTANILRDYYEKHQDLFHVIIERENQYSQHKPILPPLYKMAQGKYIAICEGDDYWTDPLKLQKQYDFLENNLDFIASVHRYAVIDKTGSPKNEITFGYYSEEESGIYTMVDYQRCGNLPSQIASLFFRNFFLTGSNKCFDELMNCSVTGDTKLFLFLLTNGKIFRMKDCMSVYRHVVEPSGQSWSSQKRNPVLEWKQFNELELIFKRNGYTVDLRKRKTKIARRFHALLRNHFSISALFYAVLFFFTVKGAIFFELLHIYTKVRHRFFNEKLALHYSSITGKLNLIRINDIVF